MSDDTINPAQAAAIIAASKNAAAASLAGGLIAASGRPHSLEEAMAVFTEVCFAMDPHPGHGRYKAWAQNPDRFKKVYK